MARESAGQLGCQPTDNNKFVDVPVIGETCGEIPPSRSNSASCKAVRSSNKESPPNNAPMNTPSSFSVCRIWISVPETHR